MGTVNYNFTYLEPDNHVNLVDDTKTFLDEIDAVIHENDIKAMKAIDEESMAPSCPEVFPIYIGDFISNVQASSCVKVGNKIYALTNNNYDGNGSVRVFDIELNNESYRRDGIKVGHANSMAYDPNLDKFWVAPMYTYNAGQEEIVEKIYLYNKTFTDLAEINTPSRVHGVTYDSATDTLYYWNVNEGVHTLYRYDYNTVSFSEYKTLDASILKYVYEMKFQDIAIHAGEIYLSTTTGTVIVGNMTDEDVIKLDRCFHVNPFDSQDIWYTGELEGMEFDEEGYLFCVKSVYFGYEGEGVPGEDKRNAFICNIPLKDRAYNAPNNAFGVHPTLYLSDDSVACFRLPTANIRSLHQLNFLHDKHATVQITVHGLMEYDVQFIDQDISLQFTDDSTYSCNKFYCQGSKMLMRLRDNSKVTFTENNCIAPSYRGCEVTLVVASGAELIIPEGAAFIQSTLDRLKFNFGSGGNLSTIKIGTIQVAPNQSSIGNNIIAWAE